MGKKTNALLALYLTGATVLGGCDKKPYTVTTQEKNQIQTELGQKYDDMQMHFFSVVIQDLDKSSLEELASTEAKEWIKDDLPALFEKNPDFRQTFVLYCNKKEISRFSYQDLTEKEKIELFYLNRTINENFPVQ